MADLRSVTRQLDEHLPRVLGTAQREIDNAVVEPGQVNVIVGSAALVFGLRLLVEQTLPTSGQAMVSAPACWRLMKPGARWQAWLVRKMQPDLPPLY